jgi:hypothetical protein
VADEDYNPLRRYKWFRPRQAMRGVIGITPSTNYGTVSLFNNSTAAQLLVVRDFFVITGTAGIVDIILYQGSLGSAGGQMQPVVSGDAVTAGQLYSLDDASILTADYAVNTAYNQPRWGHEFPFQILQPGWSLVFQFATKTVLIDLSIMWEAILAEELDYLW